MKHFFILLLLLALISCAPAKNPPPYYSRDFVNSKPDNKLAYKEEKIAEDLIQSEKNAEAIVKLTQIINSYPGYNHLYRIYNARAIAYHKSRQYKKALNDYKKAILLYPHFVNAYLSMGLLYKHMGMKKEAVKMFKKCIAMLPDKKDYFLNLINDLKPVVNANFGPDGIYYNYSYYKSHFKLKDIEGFSIISTNVPNRPFKIVKSGDKSFEMHLFTMEFKNFRNFKNLLFKDRINKWIDIELGVFSRATGIAVNNPEIKEIKLNGRKSIITVIESPDKKFGFMFFFIRDFGIMVLLKGGKPGFDKKLGYLLIVGKNIQ